MVHHYTIPQLRIVAVKSGVSCHLHPVILHHVFQGFVAGQRSQSPFHCEIFDVVHLEIIHPECLECQILFLYCRVFLIYLRKQVSTLQFFKWPIIEPENPEVLPDPPRVFVFGDRDPHNFVIQVHHGLVDQPSWQDTREEVDNLIEGGGPFEIIATQELQDCDELIGGKIVIVNFGIQIFNDLEEISLKLVVVSEGLLPFGKIPEHSQQSVKEDPMGGLLVRLQFLDPFLVCGVEQVEGGHSIGVEIQDDGQGELGEGHYQNDRVRNELEQIDENSLNFAQLVTSELKPLLRFIQVLDPFHIRPQIFGSLYQCILHFLEEELSLQGQSLLPVAIQFGLQVIHLLVLQETTASAMSQASYLKTSTSKHRYYYFQNIRLLLAHYTQYQRKYEKSAEISQIFIIMLHE